MDVKKKQDPKNDWWCKRHRISRHFSRSHQRNYPLLFKCSSLHEFDAEGNWCLSFKLWSNKDVYLFYLLVFIHRETLSLKYVYHVCEFTSDWAVPPGGSGVLCTNCRNQARRALKHLNNLHGLCVTAAAWKARQISWPHYSDWLPVIFRPPACTCHFHLAQYLCLMSFPLCPPPKLPCPHPGEACLTVWQHLL